MKMPLFRCLLTALAAVSGVGTAIAQKGNDLLLPFPVEAKAAQTASAPDKPADGVPERESAVPAGADENKRRALELADTFLRRQQSEMAFSVPRRALSHVRVPSRTAAPAIAAAKMTVKPPPPAGFAAAQNSEAAGPSSELLPLPGEESAGAPDVSVLPDATAQLPPGVPMQTEGDVPPGPARLPAAVPDQEVPRDDLAPAPAYGSIETQARRGPVFRVNGAEAVKVARARGFKFTPAGGIGLRDGNRTAAAQFTNTLTSEVNGTRMSQLRPPPAWNMEETSNTFFMFCDAGYKAVRLAPGWCVRGIRLEGPAWRWVACPRTGANTASFSIRVHAYKNQETATGVQLTGLTLEGPEGATDWKDAFPDLKGTPPAAKDVPSSSDPQNLAAAGEPELPQ